MDPILQFSTDKQRFLDVAGNAPTFFDMVRLAKQIEIGQRPALSAATEILEKLDHEPMLGDFLRFAARLSAESHAQLLQDAFVLYVAGSERKGAFFEFGATDGISLSNTYMLESRYSWRGVLAEPSPQWHHALCANRANAQILKECIWSKSGETVDFFVSEVGVLSTLSQFRNSDSLSMPGNAQARNSSGHEVKVTTLSINDALEQYFPEGTIDYVSVDTEGSEYEILASLDFARFRPTVFTVEHNFTFMEAKIDSLMERNGYSRVFREQTAFDAWYVDTDTWSVICARAK
jgi:FkbM family methyltransferase